jgi:hypothetical protein
MRQLRNKNLVYTCARKEKNHMAPRAFGGTIALLAIALLFTFSANATPIFSTTLTAQPDPGTVGTPVNFMAFTDVTLPAGSTTTVTIVSVGYMFDFGDGTSTGPLVNNGPFAGPPAEGAGENAFHTYAAAGTYTVNFTGTISYTTTCPTPPCDPMANTSASVKEVIFATPEPGGGLPVGLFVASLFVGMFLKKLPK